MWVTVTAAFGLVSWSIASLLFPTSPNANGPKTISATCRHDFLTDLPDRVLLLDRLSQTLAQSQRSDNRFALLFIDLDRFKHINDTLGHHIGDLLLQEVAQRLEADIARRHRQPPGWRRVQ